MFSHDRKYHKIFAEMSAIKQHNIGRFYLCGAEIQTWDKVCMFTRLSSRIIKLARTTPRTFIFNVTKAGLFETVPLE